MVEVHKGGNGMRNLGLIILLLIILMSFTSSVFHAVSGNPEWFSRMALGSILLGLYLIADKK